MTRYVQYKYIYACWSTDHQPSPSGSIVWIINCKRPEWNWEFAFKVVKFKRFLILCWRSWILVMYSGRLCLSLGLDLSFGLGLDLDMWLGFYLVFGLSFGLTLGLSLRLKFEVLRFGLGLRFDLRFEVRFEFEVVCGFEV